MRLGHIVLHGGMPTPCAAACMESNAVVLVEDIDHAIRQPDIDLLANQAMRDGIKTVDLSRFDATLLIEFTTTKETDSGTKTDGRIPQ